MRSTFERSPLYLLHRTMQEAEELLSSRLKGITPRQLTVLIALEEGEGINQAALGARAGVDRSTLAEVASRLERKGLIRRQPSREDARANILSLTSAGRRLLRVAAPLARNIDDRVLSALPAPRREQFVAMLALILKKLGPS